MNSTAGVNPFSDEYLESIGTWFKLDQSRICDVTTRARESKFLKGVVSFEKIVFDPGSDSYLMIDCTLLKSVSSFSAGRKFKFCDLSGKGEPWSPISLRFRDGLDEDSILLLTLKQDFSICNYWSEN